MNDINIKAGEQVNILVTGIKGEKGEPGQKGDKGDKGDTGSRSFGLNIKDFGAKGDNVTDDTDAFKKCHDAAVNPDTVFCPTGTYIVSDSIVNHKHLNFVGTGSASRIIQKAAMLILWH